MVRADGASSNGDLLQMMLVRRLSVRWRSVQTVSSRMALSDDAPSDGDTFQNGRLLTMAYRDVEA